MKLLQDAIELIEDNLYQDYTVKQLSKNLHYTKYHLSREFNTKVGMSIPMYIKLRRMTESVLLLSDIKYRVSDIAFKCGYNSVSYFIKGFKEVFGVTPNEYRKGNHYVTLLRRINIGGKRMFKDIEKINKYIFNEYSNSDSLNQLFSSFDNVVLSKSNDTSIEYFALLKEDKGNCLWECKLDLLSGISNKSIIAHDKNNPWITMKKLSMKDSVVSVECCNEKRKSIHEGKLVDIGKSQYMVDMCRIDDEYIKQMDHYIDEKPSKESVDFLIEEVKNIFKCKNEQELTEHIETKDLIELVRLVNKKALIVYLINNERTFTVFDALLDLENKTFSFNYNSAFNNFDKKGTVKWEGNILQVQLDGKYFAELRLGTGELYKLYNSSYAIEFENQRRGLSSISFETK
ncbi:MAG: Transposon Tn10 TetD protein [Candidatus Izimaplasma bacterium HR2]|nr:MAG: Transposon Tn10 TetD protein [Candidatus Izimaplasma bacterium HR2]